MALLRSGTDIVARRQGLRSAFRINTKVFSGVKVRALNRTLGFYLSKTGTTWTLLCALGLYKHWEKFEPLYSSDGKLE